jgi:hypothetical protein
MGTEDGKMAEACLVKSPTALLPRRDRPDDEPAVE